MNNTFEILICSYGNYPELIQKCINSIFQNSSLNNKIHVGLNEGGQETKQYLRNILDNGKISTLIESNINLNKDPMMRLLIDLVEAPYLIWFDDDSFVNENNWDTKLIQQINHSNADILGFPHFIHRDKRYSDFLKTRSWYKNLINNNNPDICYFPVGGIWVGKCEYLRKYNYPDRDMIKRSDDMLLGDLLYQTSGNFDVLYGWETTFMVNKSDRRGDGEHGWKNYEN